MTFSQLPLNIQLRDEATFINYYPGANAGALGAVERLCAEGDDWLGRLIYLWGIKGAGRTHLLQAACQQVGNGALYIPLQELGPYGPAILEGLEDRPLICLDDLESVALDPVWNEALFHLLNRLAQSVGRLLTSACAPPRELRLRLPDLQSRLSAALVLQLHPLSDEDKVRALQLRAGRRGLHLPDEVAHFILQRGPRETGALFGLLYRLDQASLQAQRKLTIPFVKTICGW